MIMATDQEIRNHFINLQFPVSEVNKIMGDKEILRQTREFINEWGINSIKRANQPGIFVTGGYNSDLKSYHKSINFGDDNRYLTASDYAHELGHAVSKTYNRLDFADPQYTNLSIRNDANAYARAVLFEEGKAEANRYYFDMRQDPASQKYDDKLRSMNYQQLVDYFANEMKDQTPSGATELTYWQLGKTMYYTQNDKVSLPTFKSALEQQKFLDAGKNDSVKFQPRNLLGIGDEGVRFQEMPQDLNPGNIHKLLGGMPSFTIFVVPENTRLNDGTITNNPRIGLYVLSEDGSTKQALEFGIGKMGQSISFADNLNNYSGIAHSVTIASDSPIQHHIVDQLANSIKI